VSQGNLFTFVLPVAGGLLLALLAIDALIGRRDRKARRSRLALAGIVVVAEGGLIAWRILSTSHPDPFVTYPERPLWTHTPGETTLATEERLNQASIPAFDPTALQPVLPPETYGPTSLVPTPPHRVGDRDQFLLRDHLVEAELFHVSEPVYAWHAAGGDVDRATVRGSIDRFVAEVLPAVHRLLGSEQSQEEQLAIHVVHYEEPGDGMRGFFLPETGTFYVNSANQGSEYEFYLGTLTHELQHALHWKLDPNEERWLDEGLSELTQRLVGFDPGQSDEIFREAFDTQLNHWPYNGEGEPPASHYGAAYRFMLYLSEQFGDEFIRDLAHHPANGLASVDALLADLQPGTTADTVFADWVLANAVDVGPYSYDREDWEASLPTWPETTFYRYPIEIRSDVHPYATDYFWLENTHPSVIRFAGTTEAQLLPVPPHSGKTCWWSSAAHHSNTRLVVRLDLSGLSAATLRFWAWYDLQSIGSHTYLSASRDGGQTWSLLESYGGQSRGWVEQQLDLTPFAGAQAQLRFDSVTAHGAHDRGFLLDDLSVLESASSRIEDWRAEGFVLAGTRVPVRWVVQVIDIYREGHALQVDRMVLDESQQGHLEMKLRPLGGLLGNKGRGILVISALARGTTEPLPYRCEITRE
jgi:hypothetical protein